MSCGFISNAHRRMGKILSLLAVISLIMITASCEEDSVDFEYTLQCPETLLSIANPKITYSDNNGAEQTITLTSESQWENTESGDKVWRGLKFHHDDTHSASNYAQLTFELRNGVDTAQIPKLYYFGFFCDVIVREGDDVTIKTCGHTQIAIGKVDITDEKVVIRLNVHDSDNIEYLDN